MNDINTERAPSTWLITLPMIAKNNGSNFNIEHALSRKIGEFITYVITDYETSPPDH